MTGFWRSLRPGRARRAFRALGAGIVSAAIGLLGLGALARVSSSPVAFLFAGLATFATTSMGLTWMITRSEPVDRRPRLRKAITATTLGTGLVVFTTTVLIPTGDQPRSPTDVEGVEFVSLSTESRLAVVERRPDSTIKRPAVVFLHGGPGTPDMAGDIAYFGQLVADGYDVYIYDQLGSGRSSRLTDPTGYTVERQATDLEALRQQLGIDSMILIAHSAGAEIASTYLADHPTRVERLVLISPAAIPGTADSSGGNYLDALSFSEKLGLYRWVIRPRILLTYGLLQINPAAAHNLVGDAEMDARFDRVYNQSRQVLHCADRDRGPALHGLGFYSNQYPQSAGASRPRDVRADLAGQIVPTLILKGECDYLSWSSSVGYTSALADARLVYVPHAGHNLYQDRPDTALSTIRAFLGDQPLPIPPQSTYEVPHSYMGTP